MLGKAPGNKSKMKLSHLDYVMQDLLVKNVCNLTGELDQIKKRVSIKVLNSNKSFKR